jgi:hypothetical protein
MLDRGLTEDGAAQALGWPKNRVTARVKILELPERAQQMVGDGVIHLAAVDQLRAIGAVAPDLLEAVIAYLDDGNAWAAERLAREPGWVLDAALSHSDSGKVFAAYLHSASNREIAELRLDKKTEQLYERAEKLHRQVDRYAYGPPQVRFTDEDVDQARAAGVLIEFDGPGRPIIVDRPLYRELIKTAIKRTHDNLQATAETAAQQKKTTRAGKTPADPVTMAKRERDAQLRELTDQAHGANLDLGHALLHNLTTVDPSDTNVAKFFVLCGRRHRTSYADCVTMPTCRAPCARREGSHVAVRSETPTVTLVASSTSLEAERGRPEFSALQVSSDAVVASGKRVRLVRAIGGHEGARDPARVLLEDRSGRRYVSPREHPRRRIA